MAAKAPVRSSRTTSKGSPTASSRVDRSPPALNLGRASSKSPGRATSATTTTITATATAAAPLTRSTSGSNLRGRSPSPASKPETSTPSGGSCSSSRAVRPPPPPRSSFSGASTPNARSSISGMSSPGPPSTPASKGKVPPPPRQSVTKLPQPAADQATANNQNETIARLTSDNQKLLTENTQLKIDLASLKEKYDRLRTQTPAAEPTADILGAFFTELPPAVAKPERRTSAVADESISELLSLFAPR